MKEPARPHGETGPTLHHAIRLTLGAARWAFTTPRPLVILIGGVLTDALLRNMATVQSEYYRLIRVPEWSFGILGAIAGLSTLVVPSIATRLNRHFRAPGNLLPGAAFALAMLAALAPAWPGFGAIPSILLFPCMAYLGFTISRELHAVTDSSRRATVLSVKGMVFNLGYGLYSLAFSMALGRIHADHPGQAFPTLLIWQIPVFAVAMILFFPWAFRMWNRRSVS